MKRKTHLTRLGTAAVATLLAAGAGVATAAQASANSYGSMSLPQLRQLCESHGSRTWPLPGGGTIVIPTEQVQYGSNGDCVAFAQILLVYSAYNISVDGQFGPATKAAVTSFQESKLYQPACGPADSVVGPRTWMCLEYQN